MEIPLNLPSGDRQQEFIDQVNAALRRISSGSSGSGGFGADGSFEASATGVYRFESGMEPQLTWTLRKAPEGTLSTVGVVAVQPNPPTGWDQAAQRLVTAALAATVAGTRKRFFQRISFAYVGPALDGEYWLPGFRLAPAIPDDAEPASPLVERWVDVDMNVDAIDAQHASAIAGERGRRIAARLSLLLDLGFERPPLEFRWVMVRQDDDRFESIRCQIMFRRADQQPSAMPDKGALGPLGRFRGDFPRYMTVGNRVQLPQDVRRVLRGADTKPHPIGDAFDSCARLYQVARVGGRQFPSVLLAYTIAAAEAITNADRSYGGFADFMRQHSGAGDAKPDPFLEYLYREVRSAHFHAGKFPLGEFAPFRTDPLMDSNWVETSQLRLAGVMTVRAAILDWCLKKVAADPEP